MFRLIVRPLAGADAEAYQALRLAGLLECPSAFASSHDEEAAFSLDDVRLRIEPGNGSVVLGAFDGTRLVGVVGVHREAMQKLAHKANLWGMHVAPPARRFGVGRALVSEALAVASRRFGALQVNLGVNASNGAALALYERLGFEPFGFERAFMLLDGEAHDEVLMVCRLGHFPHRPQASLRL